VHYHEVSCVLVSWLWDSLVLFTSGWRIFRQDSVICRDADELITCGYGLILSSKFHVFFAVAVIAHFMPPEILSIEKLISA
jgi:hypothetical protein